MLPTRVAATVLTSAFLAGCTHASVGHAVPEVDAFPDPTGYPAVGSDGFVLPDDGRFAGIVFTTSQGQYCSSNSRDYLHRIWCHGPRFDAVGYWDTTVGPEQIATLVPADAPTGDSGDAPLLAPGRRIDFASGSVCLANEELFGCRTGTHGFVFTPEGTRLF